MAQVTITIPDAQVPRILEAFTNRFGWVSGSGVTRAEFVRQQIIAYIKGQTLAYEGERDTKAAQAAVPDPVDPGIV